MESSIRSVYSASLQTSTLLGLPVIIKPNSTLNEKFNISPTLTLSETDHSAIRYITVGNGGHRMVVGADNIAKPEPIQHTPRNAALYNHLPFILKLPSDDLLPVDRAKYRLRRIETHDGVNYVAYYLKVLDLSNTSTMMELRSVTDGIVTATSFVPTAADLNPTPPPITPGGVITASGDYIAATAKVPFIMTTEDILEFLNVCNIIYGDVNYAMITEIGLCSGADRVVTGDFNGVSSGYTEAIGVQICSFLSTFFALAFTNGQLEILVDVGSLESLLTLS
jgi:hypothetical protein